MQDHVKTYFKNCCEIRAKHVVLKMQKNHFRNPDVVVTWETFSLNVVYTWCLCEEDLAGHLPRKHL